MVRGWDQMLWIVPGCSDLQGHQTKLVSERCQIFDVEAVTSDPLPLFCDVHGTNMHSDPRYPNRVFGAYVTAKQPVDNCRDLYAAPSE